MYKVYQHPIVVWITDVNRLTMIITTKPTQYHRLSRFTFNIFKLKVEIASNHTLILTT